jgi:hypothetical protein
MKLHVSLKMATHEGGQTGRCDTATLSIERPASDGTISASMINQHLLLVEFRSMQEAGEAGPK